MRVRTQSGEIIFSLHRQGRDCARGFTSLPSSGKGALEHSDNAGGEFFQHVIGRLSAEPVGYPCIPPHDNAIERGDEDERYSEHW